MKFCEVRHLKINSNFSFGSNVVNTSGILSNYSPITSFKTALMSFVTRLGVPLVLPPVFVPAAIAVYFFVCFR